jgi:hypothetical protein
MAEEFRAYMNDRANYKFPKESKTLIYWFKKLLDLFGKLWGRVPQRSIEAIFSSISEGKFVVNTAQAMNEAYYMTADSWNGADPYSMERIGETCQHFHDLTLSFRLVPNHAEFANRLKPSASLQSVPGKLPGRFERIEGEDTIAWAQEFYNSDTMVLCRYNAPLIKFGLGLIKKGIAVGTSSSTLKSSCCARKIAVALSSP